MVTLAAIVPDFDNGTGTAVIFAASRQFNTTTGEFNDLTNKYALRVTLQVQITHSPPFQLEYLPPW